MSDKKLIYKLGLIAHNFNPSMWEAYASGFLWVQGQFGLQSECQEIHCYMGKHCLEKKI